MILSFIFPQAVGASAAAQSVASRANPDATGRDALSVEAADGPYVTRDRGRLVGSWGGPAGVRRETLRDGRVTVSAVGPRPAFQVHLRPAPLPAPAILPLGAQTPMFVMADTHGEYEIATELLLRHGVIDERLRWAFGRGHLVVTGDMLDRGAHQIELLWLLYALEGQAARAGGAVHVLIGNHEAMVMRGDLRYLHPRYPRTAKTLSVGSYAALLGPDTVLGQWLRSRPAMLKLGDMLFVHGGVSPELVASGLTIAQVNDASRAALDIPMSERERLDEVQQLVIGQEGPLWYRGYFPERGGTVPAALADVEASLRYFGVSRIFIGHTAVERVTALFDGRVVAVQVYPSRDKQSGAFVMEGVVRAGGRWFRARVDGSRQDIELN